MGANQIEVLKSKCKTEQHVKNLTKLLFQNFDKDKTDYIEKKEFKNLLIYFSQTYGGTEPTDEDVDMLLEFIDTNKDGKISREEMQNVILKLCGIMS